MQQNKNIKALSKAPYRNDRYGALLSETLDKRTGECYYNISILSNQYNQLYKIENPHIVSYGDRAEGYIKNIAFSNIAVLVKSIGWDAFRTLIDSQFEELQRSPHPLDHRRWCSLFHKMSCAVDPLNPSIDDGFVYKDPKTGLYKLR